MKNKHDRDELMDLHETEVEKIAHSYGLLDDLDDDDDVPEKHHLVGMILDHENELLDFDASNGASE